MKGRVDASKRGVGEMVFEGADHAPDILALIQKSEPLSISDHADHVEGVALEPVPNVDRPAGERDLTKPLREEIGAFVHKGLVLH